jgi:transposase InsO family protein
VTCEIKGKTYLVTIDYYYRYLELAHMKSTSAFAVIDKLKDVFARWGIPQIVRSDNGPQFVSNEFPKFSKNYGV